MPEPHSWILTLTSCLAIAAPGCVIDDLDLSNRQCPCVEGWICDEANDRCVLDGLADADVPADASGDGSQVDAEVVRVDAGPPPATCESMSDAIFCEDFEGEDLARWTSVVPAEGGTIDPSTTAARVGSQGLHIVAPASPVTMRMTASIDPGAATELYFRAWVRVASASAAPIDLFELSVSGSGSVSAQMIPARRSFLVRVADAGGTGVSDEGRDGRWAIGSWTCVQARVVRGNIGGSVRVEDSGPHAAVLESVDTDWGAPYDAFAITIGTEGAEVELDDVMWTRAPVACP